ncbi:putative membrane-anchored protein [Luteitalea pratensis]|uniref:Putative membrane-anchored protein n=1 Tax=Luteitalea pratensis TaxID=1855912 RepID=A0A143PFX0_LUTPR|nr:DUF4401 domain-containing protein [Luteitalea pratensis]AMY07153.1 putative membrane-anchored protein [Luteitalea pratensis]
MMPVVSIRSVLAEAIDKDLVPADAHERASAALHGAAQDHLPWYLRVLIGGGAWVGAWFLLGTVLGLVGLAIGQRIDAVALLLGLALMPAGVALRTAARSELQRQSALVSVLTGQLLLVGGLGALSESMTLAAAATIISSAVLIALFDDGVYRFGATLAIVTAILIVAFDKRLPYAMGLVTATTACMPVLIWRTSPDLQALHRHLDPVAWACATAACGLLALQAIIDAVTGSAGISPAFIQLLLPRAWPLTFVFVMLLVWLAVQVARDHGAAPTDPAAAVAIGGAIAIGGLTLSTPAVSGALLLVMLGFDRRRSGLVGLAALFLGGFLGIYYYSLALSLLQKSAVLVASGAVCLAAAAFFRARAAEVSA